MKRKACLILSAAALLLALTAAFLLLRGSRGRERVYRQAEQSLREGDLPEAYRLFRELDGFRDAEARAEELAERDGTLVFQAAEKEETVLFGRWEQDGDPANGPEPLEWIVLDKIDGRLLLISAVCLEGRAYNAVPFEPVTWERCTLRAWLNGAFLSGAFTEEERCLIPEEVNRNPEHSIAKTPGGRDTTDRVFLMSELETVIYLKNEEAWLFPGKAPASDAAKQGGLQSDEEGCSAWWLRSPGMYEYTAQFVNQDGSPYLNGANADIDYLCGVRPMIWLDPKGARP